MHVKILGAGCTRCKQLEQKVRELDRDHQLNLVIEKVADLKEMMQYGILSTPALVVDGVLKCSGSIPRDEQLLLWLTGQP